jgi:hypothetical protein
MENEEVEMVIRIETVVETVDEEVDLLIVVVNVEVILVKNYELGFIRG